jgi:Fe2+ transport system protein FeoA
LTPGAVVHFVNHQPLDDLYEIEVAGRRVPLGSEGLEGLLGERLPDDKATPGVHP